MSKLKEEISKIGNLSNKNALKYELNGYYISSNINKVDDKLRYSTENEYNINRFSRLLSNLGINDYNIEVQGKLFIITLKYKGSN